MGVYFPTKLVLVTNSNSPIKNISGLSSLTFAQFP